MTKLSKVFWNVAHNTQKIIDIQIIKSHEIGAYFEKNSSICKLYNRYFLAFHNKTKYYLTPAIKVGTYEVGAGRVVYSCWPNAKVDQKATVGIP